MTPATTAVAVAAEMDAGVAAAGVVVGRSSECRWGRSSRLPWPTWSLLWRQRPPHQGDGIGVGGAEVGGGSNECVAILPAMHGG